MTRAGTLGAFVLAVSGFACTLPVERQGPTAVVTRDDEILCSEGPRECLGLRPDSRLADFTCEPEAVPFDGRCRVRWLSRLY